MKVKLKNLYRGYQARFEAIIQKFPNDNIAGPLLISPNEKYQSQKNKLLIVGQETKGWGCHASSIDLGMKHYEDFNLGVNYHSSPFWNITRKIEKLLGNNEYSCAWTNINKFDVDGKRPKGDHLAEISKIDELLIHEISILDPDVVFFFTGPDFDYRIRQILEDVCFDQIDGFSKRQFCKLRHRILPKKTFRSHHPKSLRIRDIEDSILNYLEENNFA